LRLKNLVFDASLAANSIADLDGVITEVNDMFLRLWGYPDKNEVVGKSLPDFINNLNDAVSMIMALNKTGQWEGDFKAKRKDGTNFIAHCLATVLRDESGKMTGYQSAVMDISERRSGECSLRLKNLVFDASLTANSIADSDGTITEANDVFLKLWGYPGRGEVVGKSLAHFMSNLNEVVAMVTSLNETGQWEGNYTAKRRDGTTFIAHGLATALRDGDGKITGYQSAAMDITERRRAEEEKVKLEGQNRQLHKNESLDRMAGAISHHFNNKLQIVLGYLEMVIEELPPGDPRSEKLKTALKEGRNATEVSGLLLSYLGQRPGKIEPLDLSELCRMNLPVILAEKPKNVVMETDLPSIGFDINADAKQIQQLLINLITNAWEAVGDASGIIRLSVRTASLKDIPSSHRFPVEWQSKDQPYACLEVTDSGCGIQEEDMDKIFDPFFSTKFIGRGLGLSVVLGIVRTHDSVITVERIIKGGTIFKVFFPLSEHIATPRNAKVVKTPKITRGRTVLLVDDEDGVRKITEIALVKSGFKVLQAKDGVEAVEIFRQHKDKISCLLCNMSMPRMGGWETIAAVRAIRQDLPVIFVSGYDEASIMDGVHPELPDFFLTKPYDLHKLGETIEYVMARKK
jgi:PAS domain S-box-containing protein